LKTSHRKSDKIGSILEQILVYLEGYLKSECSDPRVVNCKTQTCITTTVTVLIILKTSHRKSDKIGDIPEQIPIFPEVNLKSECSDMRVVNCKTQTCITTIVTILIILKTSHRKSGKICNIPKQMMICSEGCRESECADPWVVNCKTQICITVIVTVVTESQIKWEIFRKNPDRSGN